MAKQARHQFLVRVSGIDGYFATKTGGRKTATATRTWDGGAQVPDLLTGKPTFDDLTVGRPYDSDRDAPLAARLLPLCGAWDTAISVTPTDGNGVPLGGTRTYRGRLTSVHEPDVDAKSGDEAPFELVFSIVDAA